MEYSQQFDNLYPVYVDNLNAAFLPRHAYPMGMQEMGFSYALPGNRYNVASGGHAAPGEAMWGTMGMFDSPRLPPQPVVVNPSLSPSPDSVDSLQSSPLYEQSQYDSSDSSGSSVINPPRGDQHMGYGVEAPRKIRILQREPAVRAGWTLDTEPRPPTRYERAPGGRVQGRSWGAGPRARHALPSVTEDARADLNTNGRDVDMDALDQFVVEMSDANSQTRRALQTEPHELHYNEPLKQRLARVRSQIRVELARQGRRRGFVSRKDKAGKKCVFCLGKKEAEDIVHSHKAKDGEGLVTCPLLQQYECHLCHATGEHAHTIKWCPLNVPGVSEMDVLVARKRVELSNRTGC